MLLITTFISYKIGQKESLSEVYLGYPINDISTALVNIFLFCQYQTNYLDHWSTENNFELWENNITPLNTCKQTDLKTNCSQFVQHVQNIWNNFSKPQFNTVHFIRLHWIGIFQSNLRLGFWQSHVIIF